MPAAGSRPPGPELRGPEDPAGAVLVVEHVTVCFNHDFGRGPGQHLQGDLVAHGARRAVQRSLVAEARRHGLLQLVDRRILGVDVITDGSIRHRVTHRLRGLGDRV